MFSKSSNREQMSTRLFGDSERCGDASWAICRWQAKWWINVPYQWCCYCNAFHILYMIIEWLWVRGRFVKFEKRLQDSAFEVQLQEDHHESGTPPYRWQCQRCRSRIPTYLYYSLLYDQNMTRIWPVLTIWLYDIIWYSMLLSTLLYYCSDRPVNQPSNQQKSAMMKPAVRRCRDAKPRMVLWHHEFFHGLLNTTCYFMHFHAISTYWLGSSIANFFASNHGELRWILWKWTLQPQPPALWIGERSEVRKSK